MLTFNIDPLYRSVSIVLESKTGTAAATILNEVINLLKTLFNIKIGIEWSSVDSKWDSC